MTDAVRAGDRPIPVEVEAGKDYFWCACGRSASQPFCDGSHRGTDITPVKYTATEAGKVFFCACKATGDAPRCDGSHSA
jgi:CDGSH-type Zn-finger protein